MTQALTITITKLGLERFTAAQLSDEIDLSIAEVGLTDAVFAVAPTLTALPGEFRRLTTISGKQVGDNIVHMTMRDDAAIGYTARGFGLFLADGTLFAVYGQPDRIFEKSPRSTFLAAIDIAFPTGDVRELVFGNTDFLNPPATTETKGVVRLATPEKVAAGTSTADAITPADLRRVLPIGSVMLWYGAAATVPAGWAVCDGRQVDRSDDLGRVTTPDLRDRVPVGASDTHAAGSTFGAFQQTTASGGSHRHDVTVSGTTERAATDFAINPTTKTDAAGNGSGTVISAVAPADPGHTHGATLQGKSESSGSHDHTVDVTQPSMALIFIMKV